MNDAYKIMSNFSNLSGKAKYTASVEISNIATIDASKEARNIPVSFLK